MTVIPGKRVLTNPSSTHNRVYTGCPSSTFSTDTNADSCEPWRDCAAGNYVHRVCADVPWTSPHLGGNHAFVTRLVQL